MLSLPSPHILIQNKDDINTCAIFGKACYGWLWVQGPSVYGEEEALMVPRL